MPGTVRCGCAHGTARCTILASSDPRSERRSVRRALSLFSTTIALAFVIVSPAVAQRATVGGTVFVDANGNGRRDVNERGMAGVAVSNQDTIVTTDASGSFHIPRGSSRIVFVAVPDGYSSRGTFWRPVTDTTTSLSFPLA